MPTLVPSLTMMVVAVQPSVDRLFDRPTEWKVSTDNNKVLIHAARHRYIAAHDAATAHRLVENMQSIRPTGIDQGALDALLVAIMAWLGKAGELSRQIQWYGTVDPIVQTTRGLTVARFTNPDDRVEFVHYMNTLYSQHQGADGLWRHYFPS